MVVFRLSVGVVVVALSALVAFAIARFNMSPSELWLMSFLSTASHIVLQCSLACLMWPLSFLLLTFALSKWREVNQDS